MHGVGKSFRAKVSAGTSDDDIVLAILSPDLRNRVDESLGKYRSI